MTYTGDCAFAGTNAKIYVTLCGRERESEEFYLKKSVERDNPFERENRDTFKFRSQNLGRLYKLKIRHEDRGIWVGWYLKKVRIF
ncbi:lipoxygenase homology domain-containing protein 1-like [Hydractinia symbiolongicarpus]|uniref:lipoxygenase homology domain-containing protein 1-like n=1 Tax=Hydractinia symbiolongicarpus TaxID=13093 RepID=UPI00254C4325|nr:lipoxygenase homology domain-containing protein 1-like [Hydractinia symbiolongicarpus]